MERISESFSRQLNGNGSEENNTDRSWPLHKISEAHDLNDVILALPPFHQHQSMPDTSGSSAATPTSTDGADSLPDGGSNIAWRSSSSVFLHQQSQDDNESAFHQGNRRFYDLLSNYRQEYESKSRMEKPLVALQILNEWRNQTPPGRFLVAETDTHPPLWKDIGDKKAREKISKALKYLIIQENSQELESEAEAETLRRMPSAEQEEKGCFPDSDRQVEEVTAEKLQPDSSDDEGKAEIYGEEKKVTEERNDSQHTNQTMTTLGRPIIPRFQKFDKSTRRISEQLHLAEEDGIIYGRWKEREILVQIYEHQRRQHSIYLKQGESASSLVDLVLISGEMGVGKSSLARTLKNPLLDDDEQDEKLLQPPFFLQGHFEQRKWADSNAVFVALVNDFCQQLVNRQEPVLRKTYREAIDEALGEDIALLTNLVPGLDVLWNDTDLVDMGGALPAKTWKRQSSSSQSSSSSTSDNSYGCMAMQRVKQVFGMFFQSIAAASPQHSLIVLLDDLQYASETELDIWSSLVADKSRCGVLFLATLRDKEIDPQFKREHVGRELQQLKTNHKVSLNEIHLENLPEDCVHFMLAETLSLQEGQTKSLNNLVFSVTKGNPTFIRELLRNFQNEGLLHYDESSMQWVCDVQQIPLSIESIHGVSDLFRAKVLALPPEVQETLKIAASLWAIRVDESILKMLDTIGAEPSHLRNGNVRGLVNYRGGSFAFVSDGAREAIYNLIPRDERSSYHLRIARCLWLHLQDNQNPGFYATLMSQLFCSDHMLEQDDDRRAIAALYLDAGHKAAKYLGFQTAWYCLSHGISMVSSMKTWGRDNYDLSLSLYNTAIEICYCNGEFTELDKLIHEVLEHARTFEDSLIARSTLVYALGSRNKQFEAIETALKTLRELGETGLPLFPSTLRVLFERRRINRLLLPLSDEAILRLPRMKDSKKLAMMQILNHVLLYTIYVSPKLAYLVCLKMVEVTLKHGLSPMAAGGFVIYGMILSKTSSIDLGYHYGELALKICDLFKKDVWLCRTWAGFYGTIYCSKHPISGALEPLRQASRAGIRTGDIEYSILNASLVCWNAAEILPLPVLESQLREVADLGELYGQALSLVMIRPLWQHVLNLMGRAAGDPKILHGELLDKDKEEAQKGNNPHYWMWNRYCQMQLAFMFSDYDMAEVFSDSARLVYEQSPGVLDAGFSVFYECMILLAQAQRGKRRRGKTIRYVRRQIKVIKLYAYHAPMNFLGKQFLLQGELAATCGDRQKATSHFRGGILHSREGGFQMDEALANERLATCYLVRNDPASATPLLREARRLYEDWGAVAKVQHFDNQYGSYIA